jgi:phenylacetate 2-hydroxylase
VYTLAAMTVQTLAIAVVTVVYFIIRYLNRTDVPKIKGLPEIPGVPLFGNLLQLGDQHAQVTAKWAKKYGPVFQVRMGNKVGGLQFRRKKNHN